MNRSWKVVETVFIFLAVSVLAIGCGDGADREMPTPSPADTSVEPSATPSATPVRPLTVATVAVSPPSGPPGTELQVTATGFPSETEIVLGVGRKDTDYDVLATRRTEADGSLITTLAIPMSAQPEEEWVVVASAEDGGPRAVSNIFQVTAPEVEPEASIAPLSGPPGTEVLVVAEGFPPGTVVDIGVGREDSEYEVVDSAQTLSDGSLMADVVIPTYAEADERWVVVVTTEDQSAEAVSNVFQVAQLTEQGMVAISPTSGPPGVQVDVVVQGFPPNAAVEIGVGRVNSEYDVVATAQTDAGGRLDTRIVMPQFVRPEDRWVIVVAAQQQPVKAVSEEFDVVQAATATPSSGRFTRTNIYLIAVGDEGRSGEEIGCGDSVVPVEVAIEPTIAPLTAALGKMLALETREYGQSGLYNALYRSNLTVDDVVIEDGEALIRLSGTLTMGGVCDEPRVQAQLRETALQYPTVDRVTILINHEPLEQSLTPPTPTPSRDLFTRTDIYLIAIGDQGRSGKEIGCGDSVVPVEVPIEPTIAPLTAALNELLSSHTREYGMVGYYNALYRSDLTLEDVAIEDREAIIRLSGTLTLAGVCDEPRVQAQLRETALQYATVDRVKILINGTPLEELLGHG